MKSVATVVTLIRTYLILYFSYSLVLLQLTDSVPKSEATVVLGGGTQICKSLQLFPLTACFKNLLLTFGIIFMFLFSLLVVLSRVCGSENLNYCLVDRSANMVIMKQDIKSSHKIMHEVKINLFLCHMIITKENILFTFAGSNRVQSTKEVAISCRIFSYMGTLST